MNSCLYECTVFHRRLKPKPHEFVYRIFLCYFDLDELKEIERAIPFFGYNRANLYSFRDQDHLQLGGATAAENALNFLRTQNPSLTPAKVRLLCLPRFLGYVFNPISIFFFFDESDHPLAAIAQVRNTFLEVKPYFVPLHKEGFAIRTPKNFYVSPFSKLDLEFEFRLQTPTERLAVYVDDWEGQEKQLVSALTGKRQPLNAVNLAKFTVKYPLITLKIILLIHWEALRLWWKRIPWFAKEKNPHLQQGVLNPHRSLRKKS